MSMLYKRMSLLRKPYGYHIAEFSAAFVLLILVIIVPLVDLSVLPLHWILTQEIINSQVRRLAQCKTFSRAVDFLNTDSVLSAQLAQLGGVKLKSVEPKLIISMTKSPYEIFTVAEAKPIPPEWLPGGKKSPCKYELEMDSLIELSPLMTLNWLGVEIVGLTKPFNCTIKAKTLWENYGRDPITNKFYMDE
jgi:hypothetical protein